MRMLSLFSVTSSTMLALTSGVVSPSCALLWLCFFTSPSNAQGLRIPSTVTNQAGQSNSPSTSSGEKPIAAQPSGTAAPNPAPNSGNSASGSSNTKAGLSPEDVKTQIQQDIADKQKALQTEQDKLDGLKKERDSLNPDARGQEYIDKANELQKDALKGAIDQFKTGPIEGLKDAVESADRGKDMVKDWRDVKDAESKYLDEVDRQQNIGNEIARQENLVRQAETALASAKLSAAIVAPMVNAMSTVPVSTPSGCGESVTCNGWIFMPPINVIDKNGKIEKTYPGAWVCSSNCGAKPQSPPPQYNSAGTATNQNQSTITGVTGTPSADQKSQQGHVGFTNGNNPTTANHPSGNQNLPPALLDTSSVKLKSESIVPQAKSSAQPNSSTGLSTTAGPPASENLKLKSADTGSEKKHPSSTATSADKPTALRASSSSAKSTNAVVAIPRVDTSRRASTSPVLPSRISTAASAAASHAASSTASRAASNTASSVASRSASNAASAAAGRAASSAASNAASRAASNAASRAASNAASQAAANAASRTSVPSDIRLKRDIVGLGRLPNGLHLYRYRYLEDDVEYVGVMAQEVEKIDRAAVGRDANGYLSVDYGRLGLRLMTWEEWAARARYASFSFL